MLHLWPSACPVRVVQDWLAMAVESKHFVCLLVAASLICLPSTTCIGFDVYNSITIEAMYVYCIYTYTYKLLDEADEY